ncbi:hypothetical protein PENTCL1PPCAC_25066, partial [Pristionchus entomophagus]
LLLHDIYRKMRRPDTVAPPHAASVSAPAAAAAAKPPKPKTKSKRVYRGSFKAVPRVDKEPVKLSQSSIDFSLSILRAASTHKETFVCSPFYQ